MMHCLLITVYKNIAICNHLIETMPEGWGAYVHIDAKSSIEIKDIHPRAIAFKKHKIYWGAIEHLQAFLFLMDAAAESGENYDYYHLISGEDYWAMSPYNFDRRLQEGYSYIEVNPLPRPGWHHGGYDIVQYRTFASRGDIRKGVLSVGNKLYKLGQLLSLSRKKIPTFPLYCGAVYCTLYKDAVTAIQSHKIARDLLKRLSQSCLAEEIFFQTVLMNTMPEKVINDCLRYIDWSVVPAPKYLTTTDLSNVISSNNLFCRKIRDVELVHFIDARTQ